MAVLHAVWGISWRPPSKVQLTLENDECIITSAPLPRFARCLTHFVTSSALDIRNWRMYHYFLPFSLKVTNVLLLPPLFIWNWRMYNHFRFFFFENDECIITSAPFSLKVTNVPFLPPLFRRKWWMYAYLRLFFFENDECIRASPSFPGKGMGLGFAFSCRPLALDWMGVPADVGTFFCR